MSANNSVTMETRSRNSPEDAVKESSASADAPSGFILKLYQMVNGAPDEVIAVSCSLIGYVGDSRARSMFRGYSEMIFADGVWYGRL